MDEYTFKLSDYPVVSGKPTRTKNFIKLEMSRYTALAIQEAIESQLENKAESIYFWLHGQLDLIEEPDAE